MSWTFESWDIPKTGVIRFKKKEIKVMGGRGVGLKSKIIGLLTLEIIGHPEGEIRGNM